MKIFTFVFCSAFLALFVSGFSRNLPILSFDEGYSQLFGDGNLMVLKDGKSVHISLDDRTGRLSIENDFFFQVPYTFSSVIWFFCV